MTAFDAGFDAGFGYVPGPPGPRALCSVADVVRRLKLTDQPADEEEVARVIEAASEAIMTATKRELYQTWANPSERSYSSFGGYPLNEYGQVLVPIDDCAEVLTVSALYLGERLILPARRLAPIPVHAATPTVGEPEWEAGPHEVSLVVEGVPIHDPVRVAERAARETVGGYTEWPPSRDPDLEPITGLLFDAAPTLPVYVTARWGWPAVHADIREAAIKQSAAWYELDSSRLSDSWADELRPGPPDPAPRSLLYAVRDLIRPFRFTSLA